MAIVAFTAGGRPFGLTWGFSDRLVFFVVAEHCVVLVLFALRRGIWDVSPAVALQIDRSKYLVAKHVKRHRDIPDRIDVLEAEISTALEKARTADAPQIAADMQTRASLPPIRLQGRTLDASLSPLDDSRNALTI